MIKEKLKYEDLELPNYVNSRTAFANLTVSDLVKAAVLAPLNVLLVGDTGTGKTQLQKTFIIIILMETKEKVGKEFS